MSLPGPPISTSSPSSPTKVSAPLPPQITSGPAVPVSVSGPAVPTIVHFGCAVVGAAGATKSAPATRKEHASRRRTVIGDGLHVRFSGAVTLGGSNRYRRRLAAAHR